jgi:hypothetical protein
VLLRASLVVGVAALVDQVGRHNVAGAPSHQIAHHGHTLVVRCRRLAQLIATNAVCMMTREAVSLMGATRVLL